MPSQQAANLKPEALGLSESVIMGVAGTAPAFSIAATTAALVGTVGVLAPATLLCAGIAMFGIASAFMQLNRLDPNAGASYAWVSRIFNRTLGFFAGWALLLASVVFMVSGTIPAASATLALLAPGQADNPLLVTAVAAGWLVAVGAVVLKGIKLTSIVQIVMTGVELVILLVIAAVALAKFGAQPLHPLSLAWFDPGGFTPQLFAAGAVIAIFFYWGWDVTANLNEETKNARQAAGLGAVISMLLVLALFLLFTAVSLLTLSDAEIARAGANVIFAVAEKLFPPPWSQLAVLAVMLSTIGTLETTILQFTRTMFAKGRDGTFHMRYAQLHAQWQTPWLATLLITVLGLVLLLLSSFSSSIGTILKDSINAIGFQVAYYYGMAGFACAWYYRKNALRSASHLLFQVLWPAGSALFLWVIVLVSLPSFDWTTKLVAIGGMLAGFIPLLLQRRRRRALHSY